MAFLSCPSARKLKSLKTSAGFTILEVALAATVMVLCISGAVFTLQRGTVAIDVARKTTLASQIIQSEMERIRLLSWTDISSIPEDEKQEVDLANIFPVTTAADKAIYDLMDKTFDRSLEADTVAGTDGEIRRITITVSWVGNDGITRYRSSFTEYCKDGLYAYYYTKAR